ncbi:hypothetical protein DSO57_1000109 [Entomophthora muscae]|uniref:Uncharacterized protein n=1 Tax=Entomophthora muscae TaxID=34485 RepID=A0ACC2SMY4_9FUNG|nr:hypothetical protein DSO57_1000109 [Entomophthora muscae]
MGARTVETLKTLEESVHQLWAIQPLSESEAEFSLRINILNSNNGGPTPKAHFKSTFKEKCGKFDSLVLNTIVK